MYAGGEGDDVGRGTESVMICSGEDDTSWVLEGSCEASGRESLRFLWEDVVKVNALFP